MRRGIARTMMLMRPRFRGEGWYPYARPIHRGKRMPEPQLKLREVKICVHDGVEIAVALYMPEGTGPFPVVLGASPYRYDNNALPATPQFLWRETGPVGLYVERGYVYAQMDVRGCGKSGGEFRFLDRNEQKDLYDVIAWLGRQSWSNG